MVIYDAIRRGHTQPAALKFGREKRLEYLASCLFIHTLAIVLYRQADIGSNHQSGKVLVESLLLIDLF